MEDGKGVNSTEITTESKGAKQASGSHDRGQITTASLEANDRIRDILQGELQKIVTSCGGSHTRTNTRSDEENVPDRCGYFEWHGFIYVFPAEAKFVEMFIQTNSLSIERIRDAFSDYEMIKGLTECYSDLSRYIDVHPSILFLKGGCATLQFIASRVNNNFKGLDISCSRIGGIQKDLLAWERQIPFKVLKILINLCEERNPREDWMKDIQKFISMNTLAPTEEQQARQARVERNLELERRQKNIRHTHASRERYSFKSTGQRLSFSSTTGAELTKAEPPHLLEALRQAMLGQSIDGFCKASSEEKQEVGDTFYSFPCVKELKEAGIYLEPSQTSYLTDVSFHSRLFSGILKLPQISLDYSAESKLINLMAYETCPGINNEYFKVTSYVHLLNSLISHADDVKELRSAGILYNRLASDEQVVDLFRGLTKWSVPDYGCYGSEIQSINKYFKQRQKMKIRTWIAEVIHGHFRSPWTAMAVSAAGLVVGLTSIRTYFRVFTRK